MNNEFFLGDGGSVPQEAQDEYRAAVEKAEAAYEEAMKGAPARVGLLGPVSAERQAFLDRARAAYDAIEQPAAEKRNAQWVAGE
jgi:multidrug resistance efflux pump